MKKTLGIFFSLIILININSLAKEKVTIAIEDNDFAPWTFGKKSKFKGQGALVELLKSFEKELNIKFSFQVMPWKRCLSKMRKNQVDGVFNASFKEKRQKMGAYPFVGGKLSEIRGTHSSNYVLYRSIGKNIKWNGKGFENIDSPILVERGFSIKDDIEQMGFKTFQVSRALSGFKMLQRGKMSGMVTLEAMGDMVLDDKPELKEKIEKFLPPVKSKRYFLMLSHNMVKNHKDLSEKIWSSIQSANEKGIPKELYKKWSLKLK